MLKRRSFKVASILFVALVLCMAMLPLFPNAETSDGNDAFTVTFPSSASRTGYSIKESPGGADVADTKECAEGTSFYVIIADGYAFSGKLWHDIISFSPAEACHAGVVANDAKTEFRVTLTSITGPVTASVNNVVSVEAYRSHLQEEFTSFYNTTHAELLAWDMTEATRSKLLSRLDAQYASGRSSIGDAPATIADIQSAYDTSRDALFQIYLIGGSAAHLNTQYTSYCQTLQNSMQDLTEQQQTDAQTQLDSLFATADSEIAEATTGDASVTIFGNFVTEANSVMDSYQALDLENAKDKAKGRLVAQVKATTEKINSTDYLDELTKQSLLAKLDGAYALAVANIDSVDTWSEKFMVNEYFSRFMKVVDEINAEIAAARKA